MQLVLFSISCSSSCDLTPKARFAQLALSVACRGLRECGRSDLPWAGTGGARGTQAALGYRLAARKCVGRGIWVRPPRAGNTQDTLPRKGSLC